MYTHTNALLKKKINMKNTALFLMLVSKNLHNQANIFSPAEHLFQNPIKPEILCT